MNYEEFKQYIIDHIKEYMPEEYQDATVEIHSVMKNNDVQMDGLTVAKPNQVISPNIYLESFYEKYQDGMPLETVTEKVSEFYMEHVPDFELDLNDFMDKERFLSIVVPRVVNAEANENLLDNCPTMKVGDGLVAAYYLNFGKSGHGMMSTLVTIDMVKDFNITTQQLHDIAVKNMKEQFPSTCKGISEIVHGKIFDGNTDKAESKTADDYPLGQKDVMYVLTNDIGLNGATAILDSEKMEQIVDELGEFYILPSSIHELLLMPKGNTQMSPFELSEMVQEVNGIQVLPHERLSDHVYEYDVQMHTLYRADLEQAQHKDFVQAVDEVLDELPEIEEEPYLLEE